jgi:hypothetical protein
MEVIEGAGVVVPPAISKRYVLDTACCDTAVFGIFDAPSTRLQKLTRLSALTAPSHAVGNDVGKC